VMVATSRPMSTSRQAPQKSTAPKATRIHRYASVVAFAGSSSKGSIIAKAAIEHVTSAGVRKRARISSSQLVCVRRATAPSERAMIQLPTVPTTTATASIGMAASSCHHCSPNGWCSSRLAGQPAIQPAIRPGASAAICVTRLFATVGTKRIITKRWNVPDATVPPPTPPRTLRFLILRG
jgi:hypothetical protein